MQSLLRDPSPALRGGETPIPEYKRDDDDDKNYDHIDANDDDD